MISPEPARPLDLLVVQDASLKEPTNHALEQGTVREKLLGVAKVINYAS